MWSKIKEVFLEQHRKDIAYRDLLVRSLPFFKLHAGSGSVDENIRRLRERGFVSRFCVRGCG